MNIEWMHVKEKGEKIIQLFCFQWSTTLHVFLGGGISHLFFHEYSCFQHAIFSGNARISLVYIASAKMLAQEQFFFTGNSYTPILIYMALPWKLRFITRFENVRKKLEMRKKCSWNWTTWVSISSNTNFEINLIS